MRRYFIGSHQATKTEWQAFYKDNPEADCILRTQNRTEVLQDCALLEPPVSADRARQIRSMKS